MSKYKIHGLLEMMLHHCDIDKEKFLQMDPEELRALIDEKITGESLQVFALTTYIPDGKTEIELQFKIGDGNEIKSNVEYSEKNQLPAVEENKIRLVFWEMLEDTSATIDVPDDIGELTLKVEGNTYGCMDEWGYPNTFGTYSFFAGEKEQDIFFDSESSGNVKEKVVYFLDSKGTRESIEANDNFEKELSEIKKSIK